MRPVTPPCEPKAHPEMQGCGQARGTAPGSPAPLAPQSLLRAPPNRGHTMSLRSTPWRLHVARRRSAVLRAAQGGCPCDRAFPAPGAPPSQVSHPAPHASSGLCRGLSHLGDPVRLLPLRGTLLPQSAAELTASLRVSATHHLPRGPPYLPADGSPHLPALLVPRRGHRWPACCARPLSLHLTYVCHPN